MTPRVLVAGIGNVFLGDDGFGVEVAKRLADAPLPPDVRVADFGIRGLHLAFDLLDTPYELVVLVDATARGGAPGTIYCIEPDQPAGEPSSVAADAHAMDPAVVMKLLTSLGGATRRLVIVGCEPATVDDGMGLSEPVAGAVGEAVQMVRTLVGAEAICA